MIPKPTESLQDLIKTINELKKENKRIKLIAKKAEIVPLVVMYTHISRENGGEAIEIKINGDDYKLYEQKTLIVCDDKILIDKENKCYKIADIKEIKLGNIIYKWNC